MKTQSQANKELLSQGLKECSTCKEVKGVEYFCFCIKNNDGYDKRCKSCRNKSYKKYYAKPETVAKKKIYYQKNYLINKSKVLHRNKLYNIKRLYNITHEEYLNILISQNNKCLICGDTITPGCGCHLDHDHETGKIRGFLCQGCNKGLGHFRDNPKLLLSAYNYLTSKLETICPECHDKEHKK